MAKSDRVNETVTAAVIEALEKDKSGLVAEITADVLNGPDRGTYGLMANYLAGWDGGDGASTYLERVARDHIRKLAAEAVVGWLNQRSETLREAVVAKIDAEAIADAYIKRLLDICEDDISVSVRVEAPSRDDD